MELIKVTKPEAAEGKLAELYAQCEMFFGSIPNNVQMLGVSPAVLENQMHFAEYYFNHPTLSVPFLAMVRMLVSKQCESPYCQNLNAVMLGQGGITGDQIEAMMGDPEKAPLEEKEKSLLLLILKATKAPHSVAAADVDKVRAQGWTDQDIFDAVAHGARSVATNLIFDTFKITQD